MTKARDLANAGTALTSVSATELGYLDGVTSAVQTQINSKIGQATAINPTIVDAKGDIIAATAADTVARLAVGANDTVLTADSSTATGLKWATPSSGALTLITSGTLSGSSTTFSNCFSSTYDSYRVYFYNMKRSGAGNGTISLAGGFNSYRGSLMQIDYAGVVSAGINNNGVNPWVFGQVCNDDRGDSAVWDITFRGSTGRRFQSFWKGVYSTDPLNYYGCLLGGDYVAATGFTVGFTSSGSWDSGTVRIYGVQK